MNYIYDILVNFLDEPYDFFEWDENFDQIEHIKKIPIFKISWQDLSIIQNNIISISEEFMQQIKNKTDVYEENESHVCNDCSLFTDGKYAIVLKFDRTGKSKGISTLLLDELDDIIDIAHQMKETNMSYKVLKERTTLSFYTRRQKAMIQYLKQEIEDCYQNNKEKLKYLHYECFNSKCNSSIEAYRNLNKLLEESFSEQHNMLYELLKMTTTKKQL